MSPPTSAGTRSRPRRTQADRSAATRDALIAAARRLFAAHGFAEVPTDSIAAAAGVTRGALYHQFADKMALFEAALDAVEAYVAARLANEVAAVGLNDPVEAMRHAVRVWLGMCTEPEVQRIALVDGPSVLGWARWREICQRHVFGLVEAVVTQGIEQGRIRARSARPIAHVLMGASDEAALYVAESPDQETGRADMVEALDQLIDGLTAVLPEERARVESHPDARDLPVFDMAPVDDGQRPGGVGSQLEPGEHVRPVHPALDHFDLPGHLEHPAQAAERLPDPAGAAERPGEFDIRMQQGPHAVNVAVPPGLEVRCRDFFRCGIARRFHGTDSTRGSGP